MGKTIIKLNKERLKCYDEIYERYVKQDFDPPDESDDDDDENNEKPQLTEKIYNEIISFSNENCFPLCEYLDETIINKYVKWILTKK